MTHEAALQPLSFVHRLPARVYYSDTDAAGIVYYANYLRFAEHGRTEFLRAIGYDIHKVREEHGLLMVVRRVEADYLASALLDDQLVIETAVEAIGGASVTMRQRVTKDGKILADLKVLLVAVGDIGRTVRIPPQLRQIFGSHNPVE
jgi:acyl-CoA thioester hydrolase